MEKCSTKNCLLSLIGVFTALMPQEVFALEYLNQFENEKVSVAYFKIMPQEETGLHYDAQPQVVIALSGGTITRLEADGSTTEVEFPTGQSVYRPAETPDKIHTSVNRTSHAIELIIVQLK